MRKSQLVAGLSLTAALVGGACSAFAAEGGTQIDAISVCAGSEDAMVLNTGRCDTLESFSADRHCFEGLYKLDESGQVVLGQAASVETSEDGLTWTFTLRDDITWSDGQPVTSADFAYGIQYLRDQAGSYSTILDMIDTVETPDDKTLVFHMAYPCSYLPAVLAVPFSYPVRQDIAEAQGEAYATDPDKAVYNGAYTVTDWTHQASLTMVKRDDYYDADKITVGEIDWQLMTDTTTKQASFQSGDIMFSDSVVEETAASMEGQGLQYAPGYNNYCALFNLATGNDVLKDEKVRRALMLSVDRDRLVSIRNMNDTVANSYTPNGLTNADGTDFTTTVTPWYGDDYDANVAEAKQLLADAGYPDGEGFPALRYIVGNEDRKAIAEAVVGDWSANLGIDSITVETVENFFSTRSSGDFDIAYFGWYMDYPDISNMLGTMVTGANDAGYASEDYDAAYNAATSSMDEAEQWAQYDKCEEILAKDVPAVPLFFSQNSYLFDDTDYQGLVYYCGAAFFGYLTKTA